MISNATTQPIAASLLCIGLVCAAPTLLPSSACAQTASGSHTLTQGQSEISLAFDTLESFTTKDANRVDSLIWSGQGLGNYAATEPAGGASHCEDPVEYFGQALGYPDTAKAPLMVGAGIRASWTSKTNNGKNPIAVAKTFTGVATCPTIHEDGLTRTIYTLSPDFFKGFKVQRTFRFHGGLGKLANTGLRAYVPRIYNLLRYVLVPNSAGNVVRYDSSNCTSSPCTITDWNGTWFAEDDGAREGLIVIRDPSSTTPAFIGIQSGGLANANYTSIVLKQPDHGWSGIVTETEFFCFYGGNDWNESNPLPSYCLPQTSSAATP